MFFLLINYFNGLSAFLNFSETKKDEEELPNPNQEVYSTAHSTTTIVYREDFVPYTTRIMNLIKYVSGDSTSESQDSKK